MLVYYVVEQRRERGYEKVAGQAVVAVLKRVVVEETGFHAQEERGSDCQKLVGDGRDPGEGEVFQYIVTGHEAVDGIKAHVFDGTPAPVAGEGVVVLDKRRGQALLAHLFLSPFGAVPEGGQLPPGQAYNGR